MAGLEICEDLELTVENGVAHIALNRPDKLNALTRPVITSFEQILRWASVAPEVRSILISGKGRMFCAGDDLGGLTDVYGAPPSSATEVYQGPYPLIQRMLITRKPIVVAVQGGAYVAGLDLALAGDYRIGSTRTKLGPVAMTLGAPGGMVMLPMYVSIGIARRMVLRGEPIAADEAHRLGLLDELVPEEEILSRAMEVAQEWAQGPTLAYGAVKSAFLAMTGMSTLSALELEQDHAMASYGTEDQKEGAAAWAENRKAVFTGR